MTFGPRSSGVFRSGAKKIHVSSKLDIFHVFIIALFNIGYFANLQLSIVFWFFSL